MWSFLAPIKDWLIAAGIAIGIGLAIFFKGKSSGKEEEQNKQLKATVKSEKERRDVEDDVRKSDSSELDGMLKPWQRD